MCIIRYGAPRVGPIVLLLERRAHDRSHTLKKSVRKSRPSIQVFVIFAAPDNHAQVSSQDANIKVQLGGEQYTSPKAASRFESHAGIYTQGAKF